MSEKADSTGKLRCFRESLYAGMSRRADALFELIDAILTAGSVPAPPHLSLTPIHRRGWGSLYAALSKGRIRAEALRNLFADYPLENNGAKDTPVYAVDVTCWPRCDAAGSLRQLDPHVTAERPLHAFFYQVAGAGGCDLETHRQALDTISAWGLRINAGWTKTCRELDDIRSYHEDLEEHRDDLAYEIDGAVFKVNDLSQQAVLGTRSRDPQWTIAYKFSPRQATTKVKDIRIQVGRTGILTPVADLEPIGIGGVEVSRG